MKPVIGFAGLTHLGVNSAVASAARGFDVVGYDDAHLVTPLKQGRPQVMEPQLPELMAEHRSRLEFTTDPSALSRCDVVYIAVDVPTDDSGTSDLSAIDAMIGRATSPGAMRPGALLVILCQVPPGFTTRVAWPSSQRFYQVETLVFGRAMERALHPERFIVGCAEPASPLPAALATYLAAFDCPILPMRYESAELAKISINLCLVASVSVANTLAEICEHVGADWSEIAPALRLDKRIGQHAYLTPGLGIAGGNLERDLVTVLRFADRFSTDGGVVSAFVANSRHRRDWAGRMLHQLVLADQPAAAIAVLGLTYKEHTHSLKNSPSIALLSTIEGAPVRAYDPAAAPDAGGSRVQRMPAALDAVAGADVLLVMTPWPEFRSISAADLAARMRGRVVIDPYRMLDGTALTALGFTYATLGAPVINAGVASSC
jgi:UDPglucose 6-dehydrogenase